jgi:hypothetical protein
MWVGAEKKLQMEMPPLSESVQEAPQILQKRASWVRPALGLCGIRAGILPKEIRFCHGGRSIFPEPVRGSIQHGSFRPNSGNQFPITPRIDRFFSIRAD